MSETEALDARPWVYIASPYTKGDTAINVRSQMVAFDQLLDIGVIPIAPLYSHFQHMFRPREYADWINLDLRVIQRCDACLRIAAEYDYHFRYRQWDSSGADGEVKEFLRLGRPVFRTVDDVEQWASEWATKQEAAR